MKELELTEEQKNKIIDECMNTDKSYMEIADGNNITIEEFYLVMEEYCDNNKIRTFRKTPKGVVIEKLSTQNPKTKKGGEISLKNAKAIKEWAEKNGRKPRRNIPGVFKPKDGEKETEEQEELRLGTALGNMMTSIVNKYEGISLEEIEDEIKREIVKIIRELDENYKFEKVTKKSGIEEKKTKLKLVQTLGNEKMSRMILNLIKTRNATEVQIKEIADFYGVNLDKVQNIQEER